jgi:hypothetical protein
MPLSYCPKDTEEIEICDGECTQCYYDPEVKPTEPAGPKFIHEARGVF